MEKYLENFQEFPIVRLGPLRGWGTKSFQLFFADLDELGYEVDVTKQDQKVYRCDEIYLEMLLHLKRVWYYKMYLLDKKMREAFNKKRKNCMEIPPRSPLGMELLSDPKMFLRLGLILWANKIFFPLEKVIILKKFQNSLLKGQVLEIF